MVRMLIFGYNLQMKLLVIGTATNIRAICRLLCKGFFKSLDFRDSYFSYSFHVSHLLIR